MLNRFCLLLLFLTLSTSSAQACSVWYENRKGEFEYDHLSPTVYEKDWSPFSETALAGLAKGQSPFDHILQAKNVYLATSKLHKTPIDLPYFDSLPVSLVEFEIAETLQGKEKESVWLSENGRSLSVVLDVAKLPKKIAGPLKSQTAERIDAHESFAFWDSQVSPKPLVPHPKMGTSCGPDLIPHVLGETHYIVFSDNDGAQRFIPVSGKHDPLVKTLRTAAKDKTHPHTKTRVRLSMSVEDYFRHIDRAYPVSLTCKRPILSANRGEDWWDPFTAFSYQDRSVDKIGAVFQRYAGHDADNNIEFLGEIRRPSPLDRLNKNWPAIFAFYPNRDTGLLTCKGGENYLVYSYVGAEVSSTDITNHTGDDFVRLPPYRFAKIIDGDIVTASIQTNFALHGDSRIPLDTVLGWIADGSPRPIESFVK